MRASRASTSRPRQRADAGGPPGPRRAVVALHGGEPLRWGEAAPDGVDTRRAAGQAGVRMAAAGAPRVPSRKPPLSVAQILAWADAHHARTGRWPSCTEGKVNGPPGETWPAADEALRRGLRGPPRG